MVDRVVATGAGLFFIPLGAYIIDFILQYKGLQEGAERINVLNIRVAAFLPFYAFFVLIGLVSPDSIPALNIPLCLVESYSFYAFFTLLVTNAGGAEAMVNIMTNANKPLVCCNSCCPKDAKGMYQGATRALFHLIVTRNIVVIIAAICSYSGTRAGKALYALLTGVCTILLINALMRIFLTYELIYDHCQNVFNVYKVVLLKLSITMIVFQGLIAEFMISFDAEPYDDDNDYSAEDKTYRGYSSLVLIEFAILSAFYVILWAMKVTPSAASQGEKSVATAPLTFTEYVIRVCTFWDVFGVLNLDNELNKSLSTNAV